MSVLLRYVLSLLLCAACAGILVPEAGAATIGYWNFNELLPGNDVPTTADYLLDDSASGYDATSTGGLTYAAGAPAYGGTSALRFDGTDGNYAYVPGDTSPGLSPGDDGSFTLEAVLRTETDYRVIWSNNCVAPAWEWPQRYSMDISDDMLRANIADDYPTDGDYIQVNAGPDITDGNWHHVAMVREAVAGPAEDTLRLYVDHIEVGSGSDDIGSLLNTAVRAIGAVGDGTRVFDGDIDFIRFSDVALTSEEFVQSAATMPGDASGDGYVDETDAAILAENWLATSDVDWWKGDFNEDGKVDDIDATIMAANWNPAPSAAVPEPSSAILLLCVGTFLALYTTRRK